MSKRKAPKARKGNTQERGTQDSKAALEVLITMTISANKLLDLRDEAERMGHEALTAIDLLAPQLGLDAEAVTDMAYAREQAEMKLAALKMASSA